MEEDAIFELQLDPQQDTARVRASIERTWPDDEVLDDHWDVTEDLSVNVELWWVDAEPGSAPSVIVLEGTGPGSSREVAEALPANSQRWAHVSLEFDFARCQPQCVYDLDLRWHHGVTGHVKTIWTFRSSRRGARKKRPWRTRRWDFQVSAQESEPPSDSR